MVRFVMAGMACLALMSCGGGRSGASGDISKACMSSHRTAANPALCSCIQRAANQTLRGSDQTRAAELFGDPQKAQDTRQSDNPATEAFWLRYKNFAQTAETMCRA
ncbi:arginine transporter [Aestuarium zhoushanense]|jgi:hypothetical protein|uniref:arginine transporter n=1 Tax=Marivivens donghaensis TaxID=1699413 RepID=UPI000CA1167E|nr:arginine transporter [Marivivens donghaensis]AUJ64550.1 arginine transporter [Aestuarium zhoushanense]MCL7409222.1 arginine transporter [Marivivens donghaensis]MDN3703480.1 arginine transporter [Marivivens donghaensis]